MKILAFLPARGGSVGIKKKNLAIVNNKPLIKYTLNTIKELRNSVNYFISTDSKEIKKYCESQGFELSYRRPKYLSGSKSNIVDVVLHEIDYLKKKNNSTFDTILLLQPTSPLRTVKELKKAIKVFKDKNINSKSSVVKLRESPFESLEKIKNKYKFLIKPKKNYYRRQQFKRNFYFIDGTFYITKVDYLKRNKTFFDINNTLPFILNRNWPIDIDDKEDLLVAETFLKKNKL